MGTGGNTSVAVVKGGAGPGKAAVPGSGVEGDVASGGRSRSVSALQRAPGLQFGDSGAFALLVGEGDPEALCLDLRGSHRDGLASTDGGRIRGACA